METLPDLGTSYLARLSSRTLRVLRDVTEAQLDSYLAADMVAVRKKSDHLDDAAWMMSLGCLITYRLVESEVWPGGWKIWATRHGWATILEADGEL